MASANIALHASGSEVVTASAHDPRHPPANVLDSDDSTYWATTGVFPQEIIVKLGTASSIPKIKTITTNVKTLEVDKCDKQLPTSWERVFSIEVPDADGRLQVVPNQTPRLSATYLRFKITSGWDDFATVHRIVVEGAPLGK